MAPHGPPPWEGRWGCSTGCLRVRDAPRADCSEITRARVVSVHLGTEPGYCGQTLDRQDGAPAQEQAWER